jgi:hypothetical protein
MTSDVDRSPASQRARRIADAKRIRKTCGDKRHGADVVSLRHVHHGSCNPTTGQHAHAARIDGSHPRREQRKWIDVQAELVVAGLVDDDAASGAHGTAVGSVREAHVRPFGDHGHRARSQHDTQRQALVKGLVRHRRQENHADPIESNALSQRQPDR